MLRRLDEIRRYTIDAEDGEIGRCHDFLFDDRQWTIRYMVADTRKWLPGRKVLVSPISLGFPGLVDNHIPVRLTREQIKQSPPLEADQPVSKEYEGRYFGFYQWPAYWVGPYPWGAFREPRELYGQPPVQPAGETDIQPNDNHLRSVNEVSGYRIQAMDDEIGHVEDFLADDRVWSIRYLVVDTRNWLPGRKVLVARDWLENVSWADRTVYVNLTRDKIKESPEYDPGMLVDRQYETRVYAYYGKQPYWHGHGNEEA
jgi:hypothetical protein